MSYPTDKETFRRVINRDLSQGIPGTTLDKDDQNLPADFLERLQDTLGYDITGGESSLEDRITAIETELATKKLVTIEHKIVMQTTSVSAGNTLDIDFTLTNTVTDLRYLFLFSFTYKTSNIDTGDLGVQLLRLSDPQMLEEELTQDNRFDYKSYAKQVMTTPPIESSYTYRLRFISTGANSQMQQINLFVLKFYP